ncbi:unnamed protein product [Prunus brigantina]
MSSWFFCHINHRKSTRDERCHESGNLDGVMKGKHHWGSKPQDCRDH